MTKLCCRHCSSRSSVLVTAFLFCQILAVTFLVSCYNQRLWNNKETFTKFHFIFFPTNWQHNESVVGTDMLVNNSEPATQHLVSIAESTADFRADNSTSSLSLATTTTTTITTADAAAHSVCVTRQATTEENELIVKTAQQQSPNNRTSEEVNRHDVLHFFWNVPLLPSQLNLSQSPVRFKQPQRGGYWRPQCIPKCVSHGAACKLTVLAPFRGRSDNLQVFVSWMHTFLQDQSREYRIVVVEQADSKPFNRGKLFNVAVAELHRLDLLQPDTCVALHDIDKLPEDSRHSYECGMWPRHMMSLHRKSSDAKRKYTNGVHYFRYLGGVVLLTDDHFRKLNGFSNRYFGWGREDDDFQIRFQATGMRIDYLKTESAKYVLLEHQDDRKENTMPWPALHMVRQSMQSDGLTSVEYSANVTFQPLFTHIRVFL